MMQSAIFDTFGPIADALRDAIAHLVGNGVPLNPQDVYTTTTSELIKYATYAGAAYQIYPASVKSEAAATENAVAADTTEAAETAEAENTVGTAEAADTTDAATIEWPESRTAEATKGTTIVTCWDHTLKGTSGYIAYNDQNKEIIVAYRGTDGIMDWLTNLNIDRTDWPKSIHGSEAHEGFLNAYKTSEKQVTTTVDELIQKYPDYTITFTGHSLGGALASLTAAATALRYKYTIVKQMQLYTYGQPRTGNKTYAEWVEKIGFPVFRVVYRHDLVPRLPPMDLGFQHHGQEVWYEEEKIVKLCKGEGENKLCELGVPFGELNTADHSYYPGLH